MLLFVVHPASTGSTVDNVTLQIVAVIPARFASTRFPGKALADLDGRPMIEHVYRRATRSRAVSRVIVATDDLRIAAAVCQFGGEVRLTRPDHPSGTDRLAEVASTLDCDVVVNVQGDEPLIDPGAIDEVVAPFTTDPGVQVSTLYRRITNQAELANPNIVKLALDRAGFALYFSRAPIPYLRDEFWDAYPRARLREFMKFAALAKRGSPKQPFVVPTDHEAKLAEQYRLQGVGLRPIRLRRAGQ